MLAKDKQIYGFTNPHIDEGDEYVKFIAVYRQADGDFRFEIRDGSCHYNVITVKPQDAKELGLVLLDEPLKDLAAALRQFVDVKDEDLPLIARALTLYGWGKR